MDRRTLLLAAPLALTMAAPASAATRTRWVLRASEGLDALAFLGPLTGKPFYARFYAAELEAFKPRLAPGPLAALTRLSDAWDAAGDLLWPDLTLIMSGGPTDSIGDLARSLDGAETVLRPPYQANDNWDERTWARFIAGRDDLRTVLEALEAAGFAAFRKGYVDPVAGGRIAELTAVYAPLDVIAEQERLLGRRLDPEIRIELLWFCKPHGARIQGQRFIAHFSYSDAVMVKTAGHEIMHPPFPMKGPTARACIAALEKDPLFARILAEKDKASGYNDLEGVLNEDTVEALDQIVAERLGFAAPAGERWARADQGMHVLAAGLYGLLKAEGYDRTGGNIERWMAEAARTGKLSPAVLHPAAAAVLGKPVGELWTTPAKA